MLHRIRRSATLAFFTVASAGAAVLTGVGVAASTHPAGAAVQVFAAHRGWGTAQEVPGTAALNQGGNATINSVSCASAGNCSAGGQYTDGSGHTQTLVVSEIHGTWRSARKVPGTAALNQGGNAAIRSVSCASAGNCSAGGQYTDGSGHTQAFVVSQVNGTWGKAEEVPGTAALNPGGSASAYLVSCASAGNCSAGGDYLDASGNFQDFLANQVNGIWGMAEEVPGTATLDQGFTAFIYALSCPSAGNCSAGGLYSTAPGYLGSQAYVVSEIRGIWRKAEEVPGTAALNQSGDARLTSVSCSSAGNCSAGGYYGEGSALVQAFVVSQVNGTWRKAEKVPGIGALNQGGSAGVYAVSCVSAGNCSAGGYYAEQSFNYPAFVVNEVHGTWRKAEEVPGIGALNTRGVAGITSVSCSSAGNCSAGGYYNEIYGTQSIAHSQAFVVSETNGTWGEAEKVPGIGALNKSGLAGITSVSCGAARNCSAGGDYRDSSRHFQAFLVNQR